MDTIALLIADSIPRTNKRKIWLWKSNENPFDEIEEEEWKRYSDFENEFIEQAFQRGDQEVELNDYIINFEQNLQCSKNDPQEQRPVRYQEIDCTQYTRAERFSCPEKPITSFEAEWKFENVLMQWQLKNLKIQFDFPVVAELAAEGIIQEGKILNQDFDAQKMAEQLRNCGTTRAEICACAVRLYTAESFLYKHLNNSLRMQDTSKLDALGPFRWLLFNHLSGNISLREQVLYRGMDLSDDMIEEYRQAIGSKIVWSAYTSTTKDRRVAEQYGTALFIITVKNVYQPRSDISSISYYPEEQEVLLNAQYKFKVKNIEYDQTTGKHLIYMKSWYI